MTAPAPTWWRRNRWGVLALPVALALTVLASGQHFLTYYWDEGLHAPQHGRIGAWSTFHDTYQDVRGEHPRSVRVRLVSITPTTDGWDGSGPVHAPPGSHAVRVTLQLAADPPVPLQACSLALRGPDGTRYAYLSPLGDAYLPADPCVPPNAPGPGYDLGALSIPDDHTRPRPSSWTVSPVVLLPDGVRVTQVDLWWTMPDYLAIDTDH